jgi:hypothetical protein
LIVTDRDRITNGILFLRSRCGTFICPAAENRMNELMHRCRLPAITRLISKRRSTAQSKMQNNHRQEQ